MRNRPELLRGTLPHPCGFPRSETFAQPSFPRRETFAQPSFPRRRTFAHPSFRRRETFAHPSFPRRETFTQPSFSRRETFAQPLFPRRETFAQPHFRAGRPLRNNRETSQPFPRRETFGLQGDLCATVILAQGDLCATASAGRPLDNRHSHALCATAFAQPSFSRRETFAQPAQGDLWTTVIPAQGDLCTTVFPRRRESRFGGSPLGISHLRHAVSHRGSYAKVSFRVTVLRSSKSE